MSNIKRNILVYLDNYPMVISLPPEQRGWLFTALMVYGDRLSWEADVALEEIMDQFPQLSSEARLVCGFMGANILRDTEKWLSRQRSRSAQGKRGAPAPSPASEERARKDMELTRRLMEEMRKEK